MIKTIDALENKKRLEQEREARLQAEDKTQPQDVEHFAKQGLTGQEVISEIEEYLKQLKTRAAQTAYPKAGSGA